MATPLHQLVNTVLREPGAREQFLLAPEAFLRSAGYRELDAADVQEALFVLADGSEPARSEQLLAGGRAIGDPAELDGLDGLDGADGGLAAAGWGLVEAIDTMLMDEPSPPDIDRRDDLDAVDAVGGADDQLDDEGFGSGTADVGGVDPSTLIDDVVEAGHPAEPHEPSVDSLDLHDLGGRPVDELDLHDLGGRPVDELDRLTGTERPAAHDDLDDLDGGHTDDSWDLD